MKVFVARYPFLCFAVLTLAYQFAIVLGVQSFLAEGQLIHDHHTAHNIFRLRAIGPLLFSMLITLYLEGTSGLQRLFASFFNWKVSGKWYLVGFFWKFLLGYAAVLSIGIFFDFWPSWWMVPEFWYGWGANIAFIVGIAIVEETAWISFSLARMQARFNAFTSVIIVGMCWALWYLPMVALNEGVPAGYPVPVFMASMMALTTLLAWLYNSTRSGTVLLIAQFVSNTTFFIVPILPEVVSSRAVLDSGAYETRPITAFVALFFLVAVVIVIKYGKENLSTTGSRVQWLTKLN